MPSYPMLGLVDMRPHLAVAAAILLLGGCLLFAISRPSSTKGAHSNSWIPLIALLAGPLVGLLWWAIDVFVLNREFYLASDAWFLLPRVMLVGAFVGFVAAIAFGLALRFRSGQAGKRGAAK